MKKKKTITNDEVIPGQLRVWNEPWDESMFLITWVGQWRDLQVYEGDNSLNQIAKVSTVTTDGVGSSSPISIDYIMKHSRVL
jgi:hypothetical protein